MILWTSKVTSEAEPAIPWLGLRSWRWVLRPQKWGACVAEQVLFTGEEWRDANRYVWVYVDSRWHVGMEHYYYDGPHCQLSIGRLHISWSLWWCDKCMPEEA